MSEHPIPDDALDGDIAILGRKGGGKTFTSKGLVERLLDLGRRVLILDPLGVWAGLRTSADGEGPGYPVAIFGGPHGDLPLDPAAAEALARIIAAENLPAVIDLSDLSKYAQAAFLSRFLHELRRVNREALTIVLEEADVFAPQTPMGDDSKALFGEIDWICRRGRFLGFRLISITQRPARLHKDVLTQAATLIMHRLPAPQDREAVKAWVDGNGDRDTARQVFDTLAGLEVGEAWILHEGGAVERARFPRIKTLDTSATPKAGEKRIQPKTLAQVDLTAIRAALEDTTPAKAKAAAQAPPAPAGAALQEAEERGFSKGYREGYADGRQKALIAAGADLAEVLRKIQNIEYAPREPDHVPDAGTAAPAPAVVEAAPKPGKPPPAPNGALPIGAQRLLSALEMGPRLPLTWQEVAIIAVVSAQGGSFNTSKKLLIDGGHVETFGSMVSFPNLTALHPCDPAQVIDAWADKLGGSAARILRHVFVMQGQTWNEIAAALGLSHIGGSWNSARKMIRTAGLVDETDGTVRLAPVLQQLKEARRG